MSSAICIFESLKCRYNNATFVPNRRDSVGVESCLNKLMIKVQELFCQSPSCPLDGAMQGRSLVPTPRSGMLPGVFRWSFLSWLVILAVGCPYLSADSVSEKNVLVLYSFSVRESFVQLEPLKSTVRSRARIPVNFDVEYLESQRFSYAGYQDALAETLRRSYAEKHIDVVVVAGYPALRVRY